MNRLQVEVQCCKRRLSQNKVILSMTSQIFLCSSRRTVIIILSSVISTDKEYLLLDEENLMPAEMRDISWMQYWAKEDRTEIE